MLIEIVDTIIGYKVNTADRKDSAKRSGSGTIKACRQTDYLICLADKSLVLLVGRDKEKGILQANFSVIVLCGLYASGRSFPGKKNSLPGKRKSIREM